MSYEQELKAQLEANSEFNQSSGGEWFKFKEKSNTFRVLSKPVAFFEKFKMGICYTDCGYQGTPKTLQWVLDKADNKIKLAKFPYVISEQIVKLESDPDYGFNSFPMPYDLTINAEKAGTKEVIYSAPLPRPVKPLSDEIKALYATKQAISDVIESMKRKQKDKHIADGTWQKEVDRKEALKKELKAARENNDVDESQIPYPTEEFNPTF